MISQTTRQFWERYAKLPVEIRRLADKTYALWKGAPEHGSLHFKKLAGHESLWSVRVGRHYRALATERRVRRLGLDWTPLGIRPPRAVTRR